MTSKERARAFLETHLGQTVSMEMLGELSDSFENHRDAGRQDDETAKGEQRALRVIPDLDEEVDDDPTE